MRHVRIGDIHETQWKQVGAFVDNWDQVEALRFVLSTRLHYVGYKNGIMPLGQKNKKQPTH